MPQKLSIEVRKKQFLNYIKDYIQENEYPPSLSEMAKNFDLSKPGAEYIVKQLVKDKLIEKTNEKSRNIRLVDDMIDNELAKASQYSAFQDEDDTVSPGYKHLLIKP